MFKVSRCQGVKGFGVNDILDDQKGDEGGGPKAKIQHGVKPDI